MLGTKSSWRGHAEDDLLQSGLGLILQILDCPLVEVEPLLALSVSHPLSLALRRTLELLGDHLQGSLKGDHLVGVLDGKLGYLGLEGR